MLYIYIRREYGFLLTQSLLLQETARFCAAPPDQWPAPERPVGPLVDPPEEKYGHWTRVPLLEDVMRGDDRRIAGMHGCW